MRFFIQCANLFLVIFLTNYPCHASEKESVKSKEETSSYAVPKDYKDIEFLVFRKDHFDEILKLNDLETISNENISLNKVSLIHGVAIAPCDILISDTNHQGYRVKLKENGDELNYYIGVHGKTGPLLYESEGTVKLLTDIFTTKLVEASNEKIVVIFRKVYVNRPDESKAIMNDRTTNNHTLK